MPNVAASSVPPPAALSSWKEPVNRSASARYRVTSTTGVPAGGAAAGSTPEFAHFAS